MGEEAKRYPVRHSDEGLRRLLGEEAFSSAYTVEHDNGHAVFRDAGGAVVFETSVEEYLKA